MTTLTPIQSAQSEPEVPANENFDTLSAAGIFGKRHAATSGLSFGYYGGIYNGNTVADGAVALTNDSDNYIVVNRATGVVSASVGTADWSSSSYARLYKGVAASGAVTYTDHRQDSNGLLLTAPSTVGRHSVPVAAAAMQPSVSGGCAGLALVAIGSGQPDIHILDFDKDTDESAQFSIVMPKSWNEGAVTAKFHWTHGAASSYAVVWGIQAVAIGNDDALAASFGTAVTVADTGGTTNDLYTSNETSAMTVGGSPQPEDIVFFRVYRDADAAGDTLDVDARLIGITLYIVTDSGNDA